jgi:hypothetical protein
MPANRTPLDPVRSSARREILDAPQDDLALTFEDAASLTFDDLDANDGPTPAARASLASETSTATAETLAS